MIDEYIVQSLHYFVAAAFCYALFWQDLHMFFVLFTLCIQTCCIYALKELFKIERPLHYMGSGHAFPSAFSAILGFSLLYGTWLMYMFQKDWPRWKLLLRAFLLIFYCTICWVKRLSMQYNHMSDMITGVVISAAFAGTLIRFQQQYNLHKNIKWN